MKQKDINPLEALQKIKLMMEYDMSKTLSENKTNIDEQSTTKADFPKCIRLFDLKTDSQGKQYLVGPSLGVSRQYAEYKFYKDNVVYDTENKKKYYTCKNDREVQVLDDINMVNYQGKEGFKKIMKNCESELVEKLKPGTFNENQIEVVASNIKGAKGTWNDNEDVIKSNLRIIPTIKDLCNVSGKIDGGLFKFLEGVTNSSIEWKEFTNSLQNLIKNDLGDSNKTNETKPNTETPKPTKKGQIYPIPPELKNRDGVIKFQTWVRDVLKKPEFLGSKGVDGWYGINTKGAWEDFGSEYLKQKPNVVTQTKPTTQTKKEPDYGAETTARSSQGGTQTGASGDSNKLNVDVTGGYETEYLEDGTY